MSIQNGGVHPFVMQPLEQERWGRRSNKQLDLVKVKLVREDTCIEVSLALFRAASKNLKEDFLRRWWCRKYKLPVTDDRLGKYTREMLMVEYLEDAIEDNLFVVGADDDPALVKTDEDGYDILETGNKVFDDDERWLAEQRKLSIAGGIPQVEERNILQDIKSLVDKEGI